MVDELSFQNPFAAGACLATGESFVAAVAGTVGGFAGCVGPFGAAVACCRWISTAGAGSDCRGSCTNDLKI